jgi:hypothetical protein
MLSWLVLLEIVGVVGALLGFFFPRKCAKEKSCYYYYHGPHIILHPPDGMGGRTFPLFPLFLTCSQWFLKGFPNSTSLYLIPYVLPKVLPFSRI